MFKGSSVLRNITVLPGAITALLLAASAAPAAAMPTTSSSGPAAAGVARTLTVNPADSVVYSIMDGIQDLATGHCLDSNSAGSVYTTKPCQAPGNYYQDWTMTEWQATSESGATYEFWSLKDRATGRCLDSNAAGQIYTSPCQAPGNPYQDWYLDQYYGTWQNFDYIDLATGLCLDSNGSGQAYTHACYGSSDYYQNWRVITG